MKDTRCVWKAWKPLFSRRDRRGVALLLTLGILSLMSALAMSFVSAALNAQQGAMVGSGISQARHACETGLQRVIAMLKTELIDSNDYSNFFPGTKVFVEGEGDWEHFFYFVSVADVGEEMNDGLDNALSYRVNNHDYFPTTAPPDASWLPLYSPNPRGAGSILSARYAFILVDETGKIDPNTVVGAVPEGSEIPLGRSLEEINLRDAGFSATLADDIRPATYGGEQPANAKWFSRYQIMRAVEGDENDLDLLNRALFPYRRPDWLEEIRSLYDLTNVAGSTVDEIKAAIPWFDNWTPSGDFDSSTLRGKQICANLKDYCDTDYNASTDSTTTPTYWGLERVPYISRVQFEAINKCRDRNSGNDTQARLKVNCRVELVNMHQQDTYYTGDCWVRVTATASFRDEAGNITTGDRTYTITVTPGTNAVGTFTDRGYIRTTDWTTGSNIDGNTFGTGGQHELDQIKIELKKVELRSSDSGDWWDLAKGVWSDETTISVADESRFYHFAPRTPFRHFDTDEWSCDIGTVSIWNTGQPEDARLPSWYDDYPMYVRNDTMQHVVELANILRMEPYDAGDESKAFRKLNLLDYKYNGDPQVPMDYSDAEDGVVDNYDGNLVDHEGDGGDRNLLDLVRLGSTDIDDKEMIGRINPNTRRVPVLEALFKRIEKQYYVADAVADQPAIPSGDVDVLITNILSKTLARPLPVSMFASHRNPYLYGLLFDESHVAEGSRSGLTQLDKTYLCVLSEELVTAEHNYFTVIVTGQAIKDVGGPSGSPIEIEGVEAELGRYDPGADTILAEQKIRAVLYRSALTNKITVERFEFIDE